MSDPSISARRGPCNLHFNNMSPRAVARQNLIVSAVNEALRRNLISLECEPFAPAAFEYEIGGIPCVGHVYDAGYDEVAVHVTAVPTEQGRRFIHCAILSGYDRERFGGAVTFEWLERRAGKYLQSGSTDTFHASRPMTKVLSALRIEPMGFSTRPVMTNALRLRGC